MKNSFTNRLLTLAVLGALWGCEQEPFHGRLDRGTRTADLELRDSKGFLRVVPAGILSVTADGAQEIILRWGNKQELVVVLPKNIISENDPWNFDLRGEEIDQPVDFRGTNTRVNRDTRFRTVYRDCWLPRWECDRHYPPGSVARCRGRQALEQKLEVDEDILNVEFVSPQQGTANYRGVRLIERVLWERAVGRCY